MFRGRTAAKYIFTEMVPPFLMGIFIFIFVILMFQSLRLTEYVIVHGASTIMILKILAYISVSFLTVALPMSLLFAILFTYNRLSNDSEIVAMKAIGLSNRHLALPAVLLGLITALLSAQSSFFFAPWGNRKMEVLVHRLGQMKPTAAIKEGVFSDLFNKVVYANKVDSKNGSLEKVFIYEDSDQPYTIIAKQGQLIQESSFLGQKAFLKLYQGNIHRRDNNKYIKINFDKYTINLFDPITISEKIKTPLSHTYDDLVGKLARPDLAVKERTVLSIEFHRRWALSFACLIFAFIGYGIGAVTNKRSAKGNSFVTCVGIIVVYWITYAGFESLAKSNVLPVIVSMWSPNLLFTGLAVWSLRRRQ